MKHPQHQIWLADLIKAYAQLRETPPQLRRSVLTGLGLDLPAPNADDAIEVSTSASSLENRSELQSPKLATASSRRIEPGMPYESEDPERLPDSPVYLWRLARRCPGQTTSPEVEEASSVFQDSMPPGYSDDELEALIYPRPKPESGSWPRTLTNADLQRLVEQVQEHWPCRPRRQLNLRAATQRLAEEGSLQTIPHESRAAVPSRLTILFDRVFALGRSDADYLAIHREFRRKYGGIDIRLVAVTAYDQQDDVAASLEHLRDGDLCIYWGAPVRWPSPQFHARIDWREIGLALLRRSVRRICLLEPALPELRCNEGFSHWEPIQIFPNLEKLNAAANTIHNLLRWNMRIDFSFVRRLPAAMQVSPAIVPMLMSNTRDFMRSGLTSLIPTRSQEYASNESIQTNRPSASAYFSFLECLKAHRDSSTGDFGLADCEILRMPTPVATDESKNRIERLRAEAILRLSRLASTLHDQAGSGSNELIRAFFRSIHRKGVLLDWERNASCRRSLELASEIRHALALGQDHRLQAWRAEIAFPVIPGRQVRDHEPSYVYLQSLESSKALTSPGSALNEFCCRPGEIAVGVSRSFNTSVRLEPVEETLNDGLTRIGFGASEYGCVTIYAGKTKLWFERFEAPCWASEFSSETYGVGGATAVLALVDRHCFFFDRRTQHWDLRGGEPSGILPRMRWVPELTKGPDQVHESVGASVPGRDIEQIAGGFWISTQYLHSGFILGILGEKRPDSRNGESKVAVRQLRAGIEKIVDDPNIDVQVLRSSETASLLSQAFLPAERSPIVWRRDSHDDSTLVLGELWLVLRSPSQGGGLS